MVSVTLGKGQTSTHIPKIIYENNEMTRPKDIANALNRHFATVGLNISENQHINHNESEETMTNTAMPNILESMYLMPCTSHEVMTIVNNLKMTSSSRPDELTIKILKHIIPIVADPICKLINFSFTEGIFHDELKISKIVPIYKS